MMQNTDDNYKLMELESIIVFVVNSFICNVFKSKCLSKYWHVDHFALIGDSNQNTFSFSRSGDQ